MAKKQKEEQGSNKEFLKDLVKTLNKEAGSEIMFLLEDGAVSDISAWVSSGCTPLDYIMSNKRDGGAPAGKIIEINGAEACVTDDTEIEIKIED